MVDVVYRRYGPAATQIPASEGPETRRIETWLSFDDQGDLEALRIESRDANGRILSTGTLEGSELVFRDANGDAAPGTTARPNLTVDGLKESIVQAITVNRDVLSKNPNAPTSAVRGSSVLLVEKRRAFPNSIRTGADTAGLAEGVSRSGFEIPFVGDLNPTEEIRRSYVLPDEFRTLKTEVVVSADGKETIVESRDHEIFEVIPSHDVP